MDLTWKILMRYLYFIDNKSEKRMKAKYLKRKLNLYNLMKKKKRRQLLFHRSC